MGLKPWELRRVTLKDFNAMYVGYRRNREELWDMERRTWGYIMQFGGMGLKKEAKAPTLAELYELPYRDSAAQAGEVTATSQYVTTESEALQVLEGFK